jgi:predicted secreted protein
VNLTEQDEGRTLTVARGAMLVVVLGEARTAGFRWRLEDAGGRSVQLASEKLVPSALSGGVARHEFRFVAVTPGSTVLRLVHQRPWSVGDPDERRWEVRILVVEPVQEQQEP